jgi:rod shape-determining protein MreD
MLTTLIAIPIMVLLAVLQSVLISRFELLQGMPDLLLLVVIAWSLQKRVQTAWQWGIIAGLINSLFSALPLGINLLNYMLVVGLSLLLRRRVWQVPILAMFFAVFASSITTNLLTIVTLILAGNPIPWFEALNLIMLPSLLLNIILAIPAYAMISELAEWLYPEILKA